MENDRLDSESAESARPRPLSAPGESTRPRQAIPQRLLATAVTDAEAILRDTSPPASTGTPNLAEQRPPAVLGDFRLLQKLGEGAMGSVYRAEQISTPGVVALKVLFPHMARNPKFVERFYREALTMGRLDHPHIVRGFAVGEDQGWHYFAMEYVDGRSLQKWLTLLGKLSVGDAVHIAMACADGLGHAHDLDLVHRDVKPDNIMITRKGVVKITDLGAVKVLTEDLTMTQTGHGIGTPCYMPLEQARNAKESDGRSDIYALGCVLYCMLTGRPPFAGDTLVDLIQAKDIAKFPPSRRSNPEVPERLDLIIDKMVAKVLRYRYQNCAEVIRDLQALRIANASLSFIPSPGDGPVYSPPPDEPTPLPGPGKPALTLSERSLSESGPPSGLWYVSYQASKGTVTLKLTTDQVVKLIESEELGPSAVASRTRDGSYRALACYREFEPILFSRATKAGLDQKTTRFRNLYKKIDEEDLERQRDSLANSIIPDWPFFLYKLAIIGVVGLIIYLLSQWLLRWLMSTPGGA